MTTIPDAEAMIQWQVCKAAMDADPELQPYCGPEQILRRFQAGEIVTAEEASVDESIWIIEAIHHRASDRLHWMLRP